MQITRSTSQKTVTTDLVITVEVDCAVLTYGVPEGPTTSFTAMSSHTWTADRYMKKDTQGVSFA
jgi:hypothetical protein